MASVYPPLFSPWCLEGDASSASPSHPASFGPFPTPLFAAFSPSPAPALSPSAGAPSPGDLFLSLGRGAALGGLAHVRAPAEMAMFIFVYASSLMPIPFS